MKGLTYFNTAMQKSFVLKGRARRAEFGWFTLVSFLISTGLSIFSAAAEDLGLDVLAPILSTVGSIFSLIVFPASITIFVRRLHDLGKSGWWYMGYVAVIVIAFIGILVPIIREVFYNPAMNEVDIFEMLLSSSALISFAFLMIFTYGVLLFLIFKDGQRFTNQYGEDPKAPVQSAEHTEVVEINTEKSDVMVEKF